MKDTTTSLESDQINSDDKLHENTCNTDGLRSTEEASAVMSDKPIRCSKTCIGNPKTKMKDTTTSLESDQINSDDKLHENTCNTDGLRSTEEASAVMSDKPIRCSKTNPLGKSEKRKYTTPDQSTGNEEKDEKKRKKTVQRNREGVQPITYSISSLKADQSTSKEKLNIITWNIDGNSTKLEEIKCIAHVVFLQETKGVTFEKITEEWHVFHAKYKDNAKGVAILVNKSNCPNFHLYSQEVDSNGRYVVVKCRLVSHQKYTLVSVYNHHSDTKTLDLLTLYLQKTVGTLVIGGDFNTTFGPNDRAKELPEGKLEHYGPKEINTYHLQIRKCVERFIRNLQLVDVFRGKNGYGIWYEECFTHTQKKEDQKKKKGEEEAAEKEKKEDQKKKKGEEEAAEKEKKEDQKKKKVEEEAALSRLDYFFIPEEWMCLVNKCGVLQRDEFKDHRPLLLQLENEQTVIPDIEALQLNGKPGELGNINRVEIVAAIRSLQLRDIPDRPQYNLEHYLSSIIRKDNYPDNFNSAIEKTYGGIKYHFFNKKYLILSTILAWRLQDWGSGRVEEARKVEVTGNKVEWPALQALIQKKLKDHPRVNEFNIIEKMLSSETEGIIRLYNGCPLSRTLRKFFTKENINISKEHD
ncbi:uncharacterized protein LOC103025494 [Astyanax mexicanus]|uniref:uncharacterized protein LOC103025494 n=1 Tax=Astyanax mexicanus TaxID=7994 RepID=UPI0020CB67E6|nr:uncharacterized protein LOC103025494 [Astyanax mexicanus]